jgi:hypothetical protein
MSGKIGFSIEVSKGHFPKKFRGKFRGKSLFAEKMYEARNPVALFAVVRSSLRSFRIRKELFFGAIQSVAAGRRTSVTYRRNAEFANLCEFRL